jgi:hypothetical protein
MANDAAPIEDRLNPRRVQRVHGSGRDGGLRGARRHPSRDRDRDPGDHEHEREDPSHLGHGTSKPGQRRVLEQPCRPELSRFIIARSRRAIANDNTLASVATRH